MAAYDVSFEFAELRLVVGVGMKITEDVRKYAAEQGISDEAALQKGMEAKSKEFVEHGAALYHDA